MYVCVCVCVYVFIYITFVYMRVCARVCVLLLECGIGGVMITDVGNGHGDPSSNPGRGLHFT